jgi:cytochrome c peroxidase
MSTSKNSRVIVRVIILGVLACSSPRLAAWDDNSDSDLDRSLARMLHKAGFTGRVESTLQRRLGRPVNPKLADLGRLLWFDVLGGLHDDNTCGGCHSPSNGMGDTQSIAIGIQNNSLVGPHRRGPRNQRRTPSAANTAFYPKLMWNGRFSAPSGNPFDNSLGFLFPPPEANVKFPPNDPIVSHLLIAQAHIPPTELVEVAGFTGTAGSIGSRFDIFDDNKGDIVPQPDASGSRNEPIRQAVLERLNAKPSYRTLFGKLFPSVDAGGAIDFTMFGRAIAEFEFTLTFADAPIDQFARGDSRAMSIRQKQGARLFFDKAGCISCHGVSGESNEMFSDFKTHVAGVPQITPFFGATEGNVIFDGKNEDEDFGLEQITGQKIDRYKFRTSPLRNVALQAAFFHNGSFTNLRDAVRFHLNASRYARSYNPRATGLDNDLTYRLGPIEPVIERLDPLLRNAPQLSEDEFECLIAFLAEGLFDWRAHKQHLCKLLPTSVPSGLPVLQFEGCIAGN